MKIMSLTIWSSLMWDFCWDGKKVKTTSLLVLTAGDNYGIVFTCTGLCQFQQYPSTHCQKGSTGTNDFDCTMIYFPLFPATSQAIVCKPKWTSFLPGLPTPKTLEICFWCNGNHFLLQKWSGQWIDFKERVFGFQWYHHSHSNGRPQWLGKLREIGESKS